MNLSKSKYVRGLQCPKMLWMDKYMPEQAHENPNLEAIFATGNMVGDLAMQYFGEYDLVDFDLGIDSMLRQTQKFINNGSRNIAEASFYVDNLFCSVDILHKNPYGWDIVEVKSSTAVHDVYLDDMAFQLYVLTKAGLNITGVYNMHLNSNYVRYGDLDLHQLFLNVGGMPAAVQKFAETKNLEDIISQHLDIITQYKKDFTKYETEEKRIYLTQIYDLIPAELNKSNKRFVFSDMKKGLRYEKSSEDFLWLSSAGVALPVYNVAEPTVPLKLNENSSLFKFFLSDIGMLTTLYGKATKIQLLSNNPAINFGAIYENVAAQELKAHGMSLYYYNSKRFGELDFVIEYNGKVLPIEIKSGKDYKRHSALSNVLEISNYSIDEAFVFTNYNVEINGNFVYYPIYMLMFLSNDDIKLPIIDIPDLSDLT